MYNYRVIAACEQTLPHPPPPPSARFASTTYFFFARTLSPDPQGEPALHAS